MILVMSKTAASMRNDTGHEQDGCVYEEMTLVMSKTAASMRK